MESKTAEKKYIEIMRKKNGQERLKIAIELRQLVLNIAKENKIAMSKYFFQRFKSKSSTKNLWI